MKSLEKVQGVVNVRLSTILTIGSDDKQNVIGYIKCDPSSSGLDIPEWGSWTALFSQVRLLGGTTFWTNRTNVGSGGETDSLAIATTMGQVGNPPSRETVVDNAGAKVWSYIRDVKSRGLCVPLLMSTQPTWADVATPNPGNNVGCPGGWIYYGAQYPSPSVGAFDVQVTVYVQFRSRQ